MKSTYYIQIWIITLFVFVGFTACTDDSPMLKGRWEMFVGQDPTLAGQYAGIDDLSYSIELNFDERTFESTNDLPSGGKSYGWMDFSNMEKIYHYDIDSVFALGNYHYRIISVDNWSNICEDTLIYNPETKEITYGTDWIFKNIPDYNNESTDSNNNSSKSPSLIFLILSAIISLIVIYYLFKIFMGYIAFVLVYLIIGGSVGGLILWLLIGGFNLELPRWAIITILAVPSVPMGLFGLWLAIKSTGHFITSPFLSKIVKNYESKVNKKTYIVDEHGNKKEVNVSKGILGEKYYDTKDGEHYIENGHNEATRIN